MNLRDIRGEAEVLRHVGVVLWRMVPVGDEPDAQIFPTLKPPRLVNVVANLLNVPCSGGDVAALAPCAVLYEDQVADGWLPRVSSKGVGVVGHIQHFAPRILWHTIRAHRVLLRLSRGVRLRVAGRSGVEIHVFIHRERCVRSLSD